MEKRCKYVWSGVNRKNVQKLFQGRDPYVQFFKCTHERARHSFSTPLLGSTQLIHPEFAPVAQLQTAQQSLVFMDSWDDENIEMMER